MEPAPSVLQRIADASYRLPSAPSGITGWAALRWLGATWFTGVDVGGELRPVPLATAGSTVRPRCGVVVSEERVGAHQLVEVLGLRVTDALRSTVYEMRHAPNLAGAVEAADMAATSDLVSRDELALAVAAHRAWTGVEQARRALALMAENSWSPAESRLRLRWLQWSGERALLCNQPVFDLQGRHVGTPDLLDARAGVLGEYDGDDHWNRERRRGDLSRLDRFQDLGLEVVTFVAGESDRDVADRLRGAYGRAALRPAADRAWTLRAPTWWQPTTTVALRRSLEPAQRRRLLGRQQPAA